MPYAFLIFDKIRIPHWFVSNGMTGHEKHGILHDNKSEAWFAAKGPNIHKVQHLMKFKDLMFDVDSDSNQSKVSYKKLRVDRIF